MKKRTIIEIAVPALLVLGFATAGQLFGDPQSIGRRLKMLSVKPRVA